MPLRHHVDVKRRRVVATLSGEVSLAEMLDAITASVSHPDFEPGFDVYSDHTGITRVFTTDQARRLAGHLASLSEQMAGSRWAIVTDKEASFGMMRMLSVFAQEVPMELEVFRSPEEAEQWLSLPASPSA